MSVRTLHQWYMPKVGCVCIGNVECSGEALKVMLQIGSLMPSPSFNLNCLYPKTWRICDRAFQPRRRKMASRRPLRSAKVGIACGAAAFPAGIGGNTGIARIVVCALRVVTHTANCSRVQQAEYRVDGRIRDPKEFWTQPGPQHFTNHVVAPESGTYSKRWHAMGFTTLYRHYGTSYEPMQIRKGPIWPGTYVCAPWRQVSDSSACEVSHFASNLLAPQ